MHSSATSTATRAACSLAIEISRTGYSPLAKRHAVVYTSWRAVSILVAISANLWRGAWKLPIGGPQAGGPFAYCSVGAEKVLGAGAAPPPPVIPPPPRSPQK